MVPHVHRNIDVTTIEPDLVVRDVTDGGAITVAALIQGFTNSRFRRAAQGQQCQESDRFHCQCWIIYDEPSACESESVQRQTRRIRPLADRLAVVDYQV